MSEYITIAGIVQFDPRTRTAGNKQVRDVVLRTIGSSKNFSVTLWPEKDHITVNKGDFLVCDGKYSQSVGQNKDGEQVTYNNLSATTVIRLAGEDTGSSSPKQTVAADTGDDFPF